MSFSHFEETLKNLISQQQQCCRLSSSFKTFLDNFLQMTNKHAITVLTYFTAEMGYLDISSLRGGSTVLNYYSCTSIVSK